MPHILRFFWCQNNGAAEIEIFLFLFSFVELSDSHSPAALFNFSMMLLHCRFVLLCQMLDGHCLHSLTLVNLLMGNFWMGRLENFVTLFWMRSMRKWSENDAKRSSTMEFYVNRLNACFIGWSSMYWSLIWNPTSSSIIHFQTFHNIMSSNSWN